jgi:hypothetical protein
MLRGGGVYESNFLFSLFCLVPPMIMIDLEFEVRLLLNSVYPNLHRPQRCLIILW